MKLEMLSVYDNKARAFMKPFFSVNLQVAARDFADAANNPDHVVCKNPEDFTLYHLGTWEDEKGQYEQHAQAVNLGMAINYKR